MEDGAHRLCARRALKGAAAGQQLVQHRSEREDVGAMVGLLAAHLFGRHVGRRSHHDAGPGAPDRHRRFRRVGVGTQLGQTEVQNLDVAVAGDEDVLGFDVAMDDALVVRSGQTAGDLTRVRQGGAPGQRAALHRVAQRPAFEQFADEKRRPRTGQAVGDTTDVVNRDDVRVIQPADRPGFLFEAPDAIGIGRERREQDLDGDVAIESRVAGPVDLSHSASTDGREDLVGAEAGTGTQRHRSSRGWARSARFKNWRGAPPPRLGGSTRFARSPGPRRVSGERLMRGDHTWRR